MKFPLVVSKRLLRRNMHKFISFKETYLRLEHLFGSESPSEYPFAWSKLLDQLILNSKKELRSLQDRDFLPAIGTWQDFLDSILCKSVFHSSAQVMQIFIDEGCLKMMSQESSTNESECKSLRDIFVNENAYKEGIDGLKEVTDPVINQSNDYHFIDL
jgi:hypothetical protein